MVKCLKVSFDTGKKIRVALPTVLFDIVPGFLANAVKQEKDKLYNDYEEKNGNAFIHRLYTCIFRGSKTLLKVYKFPEYKPIFLNVLLYISNKQSGDKNII